MEIGMTVDSFKFLPRIIGKFYQMTEREPIYPIPWTPLERPIHECKFGLVTSAGLYQLDVDQPFDLERERAEPTWGDPGFRRIPADIRQVQLGVSHLHVNADDVLKDVNILLPVNRFQELSDEGTIGGFAEWNYSFMGYQGFPPDTTSWEEEYAPQVADLFHEQGVHCVLLTPT